MLDQLLPTKTCPSCDNVLPKSRSFFYSDKSRKDKLSCRCKSCCKKSSKAWQENNQDIIKESKKRYRKAHPEKQKIYRKRYREAHLDKERERCRLWNKIHIKQILSRRASFLRLNPLERIIQNTRSRIVRILRGKTKSATTKKLVGCTLEELKRHIEAQWSEGMSWENYGNNKGSIATCWHVDHIIPIKARNENGELFFDLSKPEHQSRCFHYTNLQPMWGIDNLQKGHRLSRQSS